MDETKITSGDRYEAGPPDRPAPPAQPERRAYDDEPLPRYLGRVFEQDRQYLNLLMIFHFVLAGLTFVFGLCPLMNVVVGAFMVSGAMKMPPPPGGAAPAPEPPFEMLGWINIIVYGSLFVAMYGAGILACLVGNNLRRRKGWMFCMVGSSFLCAFIPFGTALGIFTIVVLMRESVKDTFKYGEPVKDTFKDGESGFSGDEDNP